MSVAFSQLAHSSSERTSTELNIPQKSLPTSAQPSFLNFDRWDDSMYFENMTGAVLQLSKSHGSDRLDVFLDAAELHLSQLMLVESRSLLEAIDVALLSGTRLDRYHALAEARHLLSGTVPEDDTMSVLQSKTNDHQQFWRLMGAIAKGDGTIFAENLQAGFEQSKLLPKALRRTVLPVLVDAMIETGFHDQAKSGFRDFALFPELNRKPVSQFLGGRIAQMHNDQVTAIESFTQASQGWDQYAVRARLEIFQIASNSPDRELASKLYEIASLGADSWRGDGYELELLENLASLSAKTGKLYDTLLANGDIMSRFPETPSAEVARELAVEALGALYEQGAKGQIPLTDWVGMHLQLIPIYREFPSFITATEKIADSVYLLGATDLAILEYERALLLLGDASEVISIGNLQNIITRISLKRIEALVGGGRYSKAKADLLKIVNSNDPRLKDLTGQLTAEIMSETNDPILTIATKMEEPTADYLRQIAHSVWKIGAWNYATHRYNMLWRNYPSEFLLKDAAYMLVSAHHSGNVALANKVAAAFPDLTKSERISNIAMGILEIPADLFPLKRENAWSRIFDAVDTLEQIPSKIE